jgi:hypothetical protein
MTVHDHSTRSSDEPVTQWTPMVQASPPAGFAGPGSVPGRKKVNPRLAIVGGLVAVAVASAGITAGVMAEVGGGSGGGSSVAAGPGGAGAGADGFGGRGGGFGGGTMAALHGTYVVSDGNGKYLTELSQTGTVSAVSSSAITVKSEDGFSKTYTITSSTSVDNGSDQISAVAAGHTVRVVANSAASATTITDTNLAGGQGQGGQGQGQGPGFGNGQPPGQ